ncbi:MAG: hypothetical protein IJ256_01245 [Bacteroidaceae bacterium]|nr:hypothetical protein [Bacteroidaceae bacterium]
MKKTLLFTAALTMILTLASCGSSKVSDSPYGKQMSLTESESYALQKPGKRASGRGVSYDESTARQLAELDARASFSRALEDAILTAAKRRNVDLTQYSGDSVEGRNNTDAGGDSHTLQSSISSNIIRNTNVVKVDKFFGQNRQYTVFVCLEYIGEVEDMAKEASKQIQQRISDEDRAKIQAELDKFEQEIKQSLSSRQ